MLQVLPGTKKMINRVAIVPVLVRVTLDTVTDKLLNLKSLTQWPFPFNSCTVQNVCFWAVGGCFQLVIQGLDSLTYMTSSIQDVASKALGGSKPAAGEKL